MPYISKDFIQNKLMPSLDIVKVLQQYLTLKKKGANYMCCCPFHSEKTPSFSVNPNQQFFYCFGCHESGTVVDFVMKYKNETFPEAVEELARYAGIQVEYEQGAKLSKEQIDRNKLYYELLDRAAAFFTKSLYENQSALDYFTKSRQLTSETLRYARLGYAPKDFNYVQEHIAKTDEEARMLCDLGLLKENTSSENHFKYRSFFLDRVMFPIFDVKGRVIGFGGRILKGDGPKYLNSPESFLFQKRRELFGLYECLQATRNRPDRLVVVEGYMDVIAIRQAGFKNVVATLGTASNGEHFKLMFRYTDKVICCYDGDRAGQLASWKALIAAASVLPDDKEVRFATIPAGYDPDSLVRAQGVDAFEQVLDKSLGFAEAICLHCRSKYDMGDAEGITRFTHEVLSIAKTLKSSVRRSSLIMVLGSVLNMSNDTLQGMLPEIELHQEFKDYGNEHQAYHNASFAGNKGADNGAYGDHGNHANYVNRGYHSNYANGAQGQSKGSVFAQAYGQRKPNADIAPGSSSASSSASGQAPSSSQAAAPNSAQPAYASGQGQVQGHIQGQAQNQAQGQGQAQGQAYSSAPQGSYGTQVGSSAQVAQAANGANRAVVGAGSGAGSGAGNNLFDYPTEIYSAPDDWDYEPHDFDDAEMGVENQPVPQEVIDLGGFIPALNQGIPGVSEGNVIKVDPRSRQPTPAGDFKSMQYIMALTQDERRTYSTLIGHAFTLEDLTGSMHRLLGFILQEPSIVLNAYSSFQFEFYLALCQAFRAPEYPLLARLVYLVKHLKDVSSASLVETFRNTEFEPLISSLLHINVFGYYRPELDELTTKDLMLLMRSLMIRVLYDILAQRLYVLKQDKSLPRYKGLEDSFLKTIMVFMFTNLRLDQPIPTDQRTKYSEKISNMIAVISADQKFDYLDVNAKVREQNQAQLNAAQAHDSAQASAATSVSTQAAATVQTQASAATSASTQAVAPVRAQASTGSAATSAQKPEHTPA